MTLQQILTGLVETLVREELLELADGADAKDLAGALAEKISTAPAFSKAGPVLGEALLDSPLVAELYASDAEILARLDVLNL